ncbi:Afadin and alpha-actinin-binding-domain-containing protein [Usnea florida]
MDAQNRRTASVYINNLLLSRGLLRNGTPIEFATPGNADGGLDATMGQVMNLVHDLVLRRDRECDTLTSLSQNLQSLRASSTQQAQNITRLENRNADLDRQLALTGAQERSARATLRSAETRNRALREEMVRLKGTVAQIRAQCATDVRRRDGEIQRLKRHLEGRRGRDGNGGQVGVVVVMPCTSKGPQVKRIGEAEADLESPTYSLKQETTEFLTQLSQGLSDENDALIGLVKGTLATLRSLQGLSGSGQGSEMDDTLDLVDGANIVVGGPPSYEALATSTDEVLEHLRGLLTNPSFVPLEEVEIREDEIQRLRDGWERMAARWKEAVALMDGWKKRMVDTGDTINLDDLRIGLNLGSGIPTVQAAQESLPKEEEEAAESKCSGIFEDLEEQPAEPIYDELEAGQPIEGVDLHSNGNGRVLSDLDANARPVKTAPKVTFQSIPEEHTMPLRSDEDASLLDFSTDESARRSKPMPQIPVQTLPQPLSPVCTVQQKLDRAEAEAEEAKRREENRPRKSISQSAVTRKLKGSRRRSTLSPEELENLVMGVLD